MIKLYTDAAFKNGKSAAGILIVKNGQQFQQKFALNEKDNHAAEFAAAAKGFEQIKKKHNFVSKLRFRFGGDTQI